MSYQELGYETKNDLRGYYNKVFSWMALALIVTSVVAYVVYESGLWLQFLFQFDVWGSLILLGAQLFLVVVLSRKIATYSFSKLLIIFMLYSVLTGVNFSILPVLYDVTTMGIAFGCTSILFISLAIIGHTTKVDITKFSGILMAGLISLIVVTAVNMFLQLDGLAMFINYFGIVLFMGLTVYDMQKIKAIHAQYSGDATLLQNFSIYCALQLYLDFINLFLYILRILGRRK